MSDLSLIRFSKLILLALVLLNQSCSLNGKENYLNEFTAFVSDAEKNYTGYSSEDWEISDVKFKEFTETKFEKNKKVLTKEDKRSIGRLMARYSLVRAKGYGKQFKDGLDDAQNYIKGFLEGLTDETDEKNMLHDNSQGDDK